MSRISNHTWLIHTLLKVLIKHIVLYAVTSDDYTLSAALKWYTGICYDLLHLFGLQYCYDLPS